MKNKTKHQKKNVRSFIGFLLVLGLLSVLGTGCGSSAGGETPATAMAPAQEEPEDSIIVGFSQIGSESGWRDANTISVQEALSQKKGYFLIYKNARQKQENQIKAVRGFISQRVDYIVLVPNTENGWENVLIEAREAGIPIILLDRQVDVSDRSLYTCWIGEDFNAEGEKAGKWLNDYLRSCNRHEEEIKIVVLKGTEGSTAQIGRSEGFNTIARRHSNWQILEEVCADFTTAKGKEVMAELLERYSDIDVVVSQNDDMTFGALDAIDAAGHKAGVDGDITVISFDAVHEALCLVRDGIINVDIECNPCSGEYVAEVISKIEKGDAIGKTYIVEEMVFTRDNVEEYLENRAY